MTFCDPVFTYARSNGQALAILDLESDRRWTYAALHGAVDRLAAWLEADYGANSGVRIATLSKNCAEMVILHHACARAGAVFVPFNWRLAVAEIEALAADAEPELLFHDLDFAPPAAAKKTMLVADVLRLGQEERAKRCRTPSVRGRCDSALHFRHQRSPQRGDAVRGQ
jgi:fatty-acyl-CoA synthase